MLVRLHRTVRPRRGAETRNRLGAPRIFGEENLGSGESALVVDGEDDLQDELEARLRDQAML